MSVEENVWYKVQYHKQRVEIIYYVGGKIAH